jgi:small subunit ribosomal protein S17
MKRIIKGTVVSNKMNKTVIVQVDRMVPHPKYGKRYRISKRFAAHHEDGTLQIGDSVTIQESRPLSKTKHWTVVKNTSGTP